MLVWSQQLKNPMIINRLPVSVGLVNQTLQDLVLVLLGEMVSSNRTIIRERAREAGSSMCSEEAIPKIIQS